MNNASPQEKLKRLKDEQANLERSIKEQELLNSLAKYKQDLEGKVTIICNKSQSRKSGTLTLTYYETIYIKGERIYFSGRSISASYNKHGIISGIETRIHGKEFSSDGLTGYNYSHLQYITIEQFNNLEKGANNFIKAFMSTDFIVANFVQDGIEQQRSKVIEKEHSLLDIPHVVLNKKQVWKLKNTVFLIENLFILSPNSIKWLEDWYADETNSNSFRHEYLTGKEYEYLANSQTEASEVYNLIKNAYNDLDKKKGV